MSEIPFPQALRPVRPGAVSIDLLTAEPYSDHRRVRITAELSGEGRRPNLEFILLDESGTEQARSLIVEALNEHTEFTMHLRQESRNQSMTLTCRAYFEGNDIKTEKQITFSL